MKPLAPHFKTYIFGILAQFVTIWHKQKRWVFFFEFGPLQDPCVRNGPTGPTKVFLGCNRYNSATIWAVYYTSSSTKRKQSLSVTHSITILYLVMYLDEVMAPMMMLARWYYCDGKLCNWSSRDLAHMGPEGVLN